MRSNKHNISLVFNGEIYNYLQLKARINFQGYLFKSKGDAGNTERIFGVG